MHQTKKLAWIAFSYWCLLTHSALSDHPKWVDTLPSFTDPDGNDFGNVVVDYNDTGDVFVGGRNVLYHFSADLELKQKVATGPLEDAHGCPIPPYDCDHTRVPTANHNTLLKMVYHLGSPPNLLFCGTAYRTMCQVIPTSNLNESHWIHPYNESLSSTGHFNRAFFGRGYGGQWTLFTASTDNMRVRTRHTAPFLTSKVLAKEGDDYSFRYSFQNGTTTSSVRLKENKMRVVVDGGFVHEEFAYFLLHTTQGVETVSRLMRFCTGDATFRSYAEVPIECNHSNRPVMLASALHFGNATDSTEKALFVTFDKPSGESVLCVFPMTKVVESFTKPKRYCNRDIVGETCSAWVKKEIVDFCGSEVSPYIERLPLVTNVVLFQSKTKIVAVTTIRQHKDTVAVVGAVDNSIRKINLSTGKDISSSFLNNTLKGLLRRPFVLDGDNQNIYLLLKNKIIKYPLSSCGTHENCSVCLTHGQSDPLQCGWCNGRCAHMEECGGRCAHMEECGGPSSFSRNTCSPIIYEVSPLTGPIQGGIKIKITGDSLGSHSVEAGSYSISVAGIPCKLLSGDQSEVTCILGSTPAITAGPVQLNVSTNYSSSIGYSVAGSSTSHQNFSYYVGPRLFGVRPNKGPTSGGTNVKIFGENLDFDQDKERFFIIRQRLCTLDRFSLDRNTVYCITGNETRIEYPDTIAVRVGDVTYVMDKNPSSALNITGLSQNFQYTEDPKITGVAPGITTMSGLRNVTVVGTHLDSVQFPKMIVRINISRTSGELEIPEDCWSNPKSNGTTMTCRTPSLRQKPGVPIPTRTHPLQTQVSFLMDGVQVMRDFHKQRADLSRLLYYPDPEVHGLRGIQKMSTENSVLQIQGSYLDLVNKDENFEVRIGEDHSCKVKNVYVEFIRCDIPPSLLSNSSAAGENISVSVIMGNTRRRLGYIEITPLEVEFANSEHLWLITLIIIPVLGIIVAYAIYFRSMKNKSRRQFDGTLLTYQAGSSTTTTTTDYASQIQNTTENRGNDMPIVDSETMLLLQDKNLLIAKTCLIFGEKVGAGQFGCVFEGFLKQPDTGEDVRVAIKTLREHSWSNPQSSETFLREALVMKDFNHPNVLNLLGICFEGSGPSIVLPFMENGDLCSYLKDDTKTLLVSNLLQFAIDVAAGMTYLGEKKFVHRDLAARNCILDSNLIVKVADFGLSRDVYTDDYYCCENKKAMLPYRWMAPESLEKSLYSTKTDVWSYGILLWELMTRGSIPYANVGSWDVLQYIKLGNRLDQPELCPEPIYRVMLACWNKESKKRPTFPVIQIYLDQIQQWLQCSEHKEDSSEYIPAQHTMYYNSKELYHNMEDYVLNTDII